MPTISPDVRSGPGPTPTETDYPLVRPSPGVRGLLSDFQLVYRAGAMAPHRPPLRIAWLHGFDAAFGLAGGESSASSSLGGSGGGAADGGYFAADYFADDYFGAGYFGDDAPVGGGGFGGGAGFFDPAYFADDYFAGGYFGAATHAADVVVVDAADAVVFNSIMGTYHGAALGADYYVHEWATADATCRAVQRASFPSAAAVHAYPADFHPASAVLDPRAYCRLPRRLDSVTVAGVAVRGRSLSLAAGYNLRITAGPPAAGARRSTPVTLAVESGAGAGLVPAADEGVVVRRINDQVADDRGNLNLTAVDCVWVRQPTVIAGRPSRASLVEGTLRIGDDCTPACGPADYAGVMAMAVAAWDRAAVVAARAASARDAYEAARRSWLKLKDCRESLWTTLRLVKHGTQFVEVAAALCNHDDECLRHASIHFTVATAASATVHVVAEETTFRSDGVGGLEAYTLLGAVGGYKAYWASIPPRGRVVVRFRLTLAVVPTTVTVRAKASAAGRYVPGHVATAVVALP